jgi:hypothetical protein
MTQTADSIDATHRANEHPDDCSTASIAAALDGRKLFNPQLRQTVVPICRRCEEKNSKRQMAGVDIVSPEVTHGDRVTVTAIHVADDDRRRPPHWNIRSVSHISHPQVNFADCIQQGTSLVRAHATIHTAPDGDAYIIDVDVTGRSTSSEGPSQSVVDARQEQFIDDSGEYPAHMNVIDRDPEDAPASWPEAEREWLHNLVEAHGPLEMPVFSVEEGDVPGSNPRGDTGE